MIIRAIHVNNRSVDNYNHHYCTVLQLAETQVANTHGSGVGMYMDLLMIVSSQMLQILSESAVIQEGVSCNLH